MARLHAHSTEHYSGRVEDRAESDTGSYEANLVGGLDGRSPVVSVMMWW